MFLSTYEKQLDGKRRLLIPQEFRTTENGAEHGVFCFFSIESDCLEAGGDKLMAEYVSMIEELPFGDDVRTALEETFYAGQRPLAYDGGGRITLPEHLCEDAGLGEDVVIVGSVRASRSGTAPAGTRAATSAGRWPATRCASVARRGARRCWPGDARAGRAHEPARPRPAGGSA